MVSADDKVIVVAVSAVMRYDTPPRVLLPAEPVTRICWPTAKPSVSQLPLVRTRLPGALPEPPLK